MRLLVVADACTDATAAVAAEGGAEVIEIRARNVGAARAAGMAGLLRRTAGTDPAAVWLATTDADTVVPPGWLRRQLGYAGQGWDMVLGTVTVTDWAEHPPHRPAVFAAMYGFGAGPHPHVHGANLGIRASAYLAAGGFRPLRTAEDHALMAAATEAGCQVLQASDVTVETSARRRARAPRGFSHVLRALAQQPASGSLITPEARGRLSVPRPARRRPSSSLCVTPRRRPRNGEPAMADIVELITADHRRIERRYGSDSPDLLAAHTQAEEETCYASLPGAGAQATGPMRESIADHHDIREIIGEASSHSVGSAPWWHAVRTVIAVSAEHHEREERYVLPSCVIGLDMNRRKELGRQWCAFMAAWGPARRPPHRNPAPARLTFPARVEAPPWA